MHPIEKNIEKLSTMLDRIKSTTSIDEALKIHDKAVKLADDSIKMIEQTKSNIKICD